MRKLFYLILIIFGFSEIARAVELEYSPNTFNIGGGIKISSMTATPELGMIRFQGGLFEGFMPGGWRRFTDNLGNHIATTTLNMGGYSITSTGGVYFQDGTVWISTAHAHSGYATISSVAEIAASTPSVTSRANWDTAYSWGNPAGLYAPIAHNQAADTITNAVVDLQSVKVGSATVALSCSGNADTATTAAQLGGVPAASYALNRDTFTSAAIYTSSPSVSGIWSFDYLKLRATSPHFQTYITMGLSATPTVTDWVCQTYTDGGYELFRGDLTPGIYVSSDGITGIGYSSNADGVNFTALNHSAKLNVAGNIRNIGYGLATSSITFTDGSVMASTSHAHTEYATVSDVLDVTRSTVSIGSASYQAAAGDHQHTGIYYSTGTDLNIGDHQITNVSSITVNGSITADTFYGDGSQLSGVASESGTEAHPQADFYMGTDTYFHFDGTKVSLIVKGNLEQQWPSSDRVTFAGESITYNGQPVVW